MILKFLKDAPCKVGKGYKANTEVALTDGEWGKMLIDEGYAVRVDNVANTVGEIIKESKRKIKKDK